VQLMAHQYFSFSHPSPLCAVQVADTSVYQKVKVKKICLKFDNSV